MKLPSIQWTLPLIFLLWCIVGTWVHGIVMLAYPAMWAVVGIFFLVLRIVLKLDSAGSGTSSPPTS